MEESMLATHVIDSLRWGKPPQRGVHLYSVGNEKLIEGFQKYHLSGIGERGTIRFVSGSWGAGKTHFFRLLREVAFQQDCLVADVELKVNETPLNKFERVFYSIIRNLVNAGYYAEDVAPEAAPFGRVVRECLTYLATGSRSAADGLAYEHYSKASEALMADRGIDIDFKKMIQEYWKTFLPEGAEPMIQERTRAESFSGLAERGPSVRIASGSVSTRWLQRKTRS